MAILDLPGLEVRIGVLLYLLDSIYIQHIIMFDMHHLHTICRGDKLSRTPPSDTHMRDDTHSHFLRADAYPMTECAFVIQGICTRDSGQRLNHLLVHHGKAQGGCAAQ